MRRLEMKVGILHGPRDLRLDDAAPFTLGPDDILVKVAAAGICGTDLHFRHLGTRFGKPMALGHEFSGVVVEAGPKVESFKVGDRVAYNSNNSPADMGRGGECGGFSEYVALRGVDAHTQSLCRVPANVSLSHAALVEPLSVATHAVNRADPKPGESVALFGTGPIGLGVIMALRRRGIDDVITFDLSPLRRDRALAVGARAAFDPRENPPAKILGELRGHGLVWGEPYPKTDIYIEASGAPGILAEIAGFCYKNSRIITLAMNREPVTLDASRIMSKETSIIGAQGYPVEFPQVMDGLSDGSINAEAMISHRFEFSNFLNAFEVASDAAVAAKVVLEFN
jgi:(R,R)-butanediol dehydrogenase / meso-butanediol dehydrogenase / diacetyl reductase